jgi:head-tail adaptor
MSRVGHLLNSSAEVWRQLRSDDGMGGWNLDWASVGVARARFSQPSAAERVIAAQNGADLSHVVHLADTADVRRGDELRRGTKIFEVIAVYEPSMPGTYLRADCKFRQGEV